MLHQAVGLVGVSCELVVDDFGIILGSIWDPLGIILGLFRANTKYKHTVEQNKEETQIYIYIYIYIIYIYYISEAMMGGFHCGFGWDYFCIIIEFILDSSRFLFVFVST